MTDRLADISRWLEQDLADVERAIATVGKNGATSAEKSARHLLDRGGKRLRPICVALASRMGSGFNDTARTFAIAVEMVHNATLLHDDVVDLGDVRRGAPAARMIYGNAASIFGGDWLLVEALTRVQSAGVPGVLDRVLAVIREMVIAEASQLERRGKPSATAREYFEIARGKTASLFRLAMFAGARAGGTSDEVCAALEEYGSHLGLAFQIVDDVLDFDGDGAELGKTLLTDLREGKMTYPLIIAAQKSPSVAPLLDEVCAAEEAAIPPDLARRITGVVRETHATRIALDLATEMCAEATACLARLPAGRARDALAGVALATPSRRK
jgi:octaprenyl-diphosphate synthase